MHDWASVLEMRGRYPSRAELEGHYNEAIKFHGHGKWSLIDHDDLLKMRTLVEDCRAGRANLAEWLGLCSGNLFRRQRR